MKFSLSSSQQKSLLIRGQPLLIALPMQRDCETDEAARQLAAEWLVLPAGCRIVSASIQEIEVEPPRKPSTESLPTLLGAILRDAPGTPWLITRQVVIITLVRGPDERHNPSAPMWPGGKLAVDHGVF